MAFLNNLMDSEGNVVLQKFDGSTLPKQLSDDDNCTTLCFLDLETTGLDKKEHKIIELAIKSVAIDKETGLLAGIIDEYQSFHDPKEPIDEKISQINGITNDMVSDQEIDWDIVHSIIDKADIIVAHNAGFDRAFMDRYLPLSNEKVWACSVNEIDWLGRGFSSKAQEILCMWHVFHFESHRAMSDVDALINLVTHKSYKSNTPIKELIDNAYKPAYKIAANDSPYETKDALKERGYNWNNDERYWWNTFTLDEVEDEKRWLADRVYNGSFKGTVTEFLITEKYK